MWGFPSRRCVNIVVVGGYIMLSDEFIKLRRWTLGDLDHLVAACNDPELRLRLGMQQPYSIADAAAYVELADAGWRVGDQFIFAVTNIGDEVVGSVRLGKGTAGATAGYWTAPWARRRGFASRALTLLSTWGEEKGLRPIRLYIAPDNVGSVEVARAAGFELCAEQAILDEEGKPGDLVFLRDSSRYIA